MLEMLVIADDLTGAADCVAGWAGFGLDSIVMLEGCAEPPNADVLAIDMATRGMTRERAAALMASVVTARTRRERPRVLYKKMDSTLRGHWAAELAATLEAWRGLDSTQRSAVAILAPAFPATGRTTSGGRQYVNGLALPQDLGAQLEASGLRTALVGPGQLRIDGTAPEDAKDADVWICDAEREDDLRAIAMAAVARGPNAIWAGSGGLARHAPAALGRARRAATVPTAAPAEGPIVCIVGSLSDVARDQVARLAAEPDVFATTLRRETLANGEGTAEWSRWTASLRVALDAGQDVVLSVASQGHGPTEEPTVAAALARFAAPHAARGGGLVLTGGDTARTVLEALHVRWLRIGGEVEPGVPFSIAGPRPRPIVTKAGAFGDQDTLLHCRAAMRASA